MSADIIPLHLPPAAEVPANITPMPAPPPQPPEDALSKLLKNPLVLAGGAMLAGAALTRLFSTTPMRKLAQDLAGEALKQAKAATAPPAQPPTLVEQGLEAIRPQLQEAVKSLLTTVLRRQ